MTWPWNLPVALLLLPRRTGRFLVIISLAGLLSGSVTADIEELKNRTDEYYNNQQYDLIVEVLEPFKDGDSAELLWRLARARYQQQKSLGSEAEKRELLEETMKTVERAMSLDSTDPNCHKWMTIYQNAITKLQGTAARLKRSYDIRHLVYQLTLQVQDLQLSVEGLEKERDFYFGKLRDIEVICQEEEGVDNKFAQRILDILYATEEVFAAPEDEDGVGVPPLPDDEEF